MFAKKLYSCVLTILLVAGLSSAIISTQGCGGSSDGEKTTNVTGPDFEQLVAGDNDFSKKADVCAKYYGRGYCTDYIEKMTGKRQKGNAENWKSSIKKKNVKKGDVAIFKSGHVAMVEKTNKDKKGNVVSVDIGEWNYGNSSCATANPGCRVTCTFGKKTTRKNIGINSVDGGFWRP